MQLVDQPLILGVSPDRDPKVAAAEPRKTRDVANEDVLLFKFLTQIGAGDAGSEDAHEQKLRFRSTSAR